MQNKAFFTVTEVAKMLKISRVAVYKRIKMGKLRVQKAGRIFLIPKKEIERLSIGGLSDKTKQSIDAVVEKAVTEYGETFKLLGKE